MSDLRFPRPAVLAGGVAVLVWVLTINTDPLDRLYSLNMALSASNSAYLFFGAAGGAAAAVETGLWRRHAAARALDASSARSPLALSMHRLTPVLGWFVGATVLTVACAAAVGGGVAPWQERAAVVLAAAAGVFLSISVGAFAGRYLPYGLGPLVGALSTYALYVPSVVSGGSGVMSVLPVMDAHPAPYLSVRPEAFVLGAVLMGAAGSLLLALSGPRRSHAALPTALAAVMVAVTVPLAGVSPHTQDEVFFARAPVDPACSAYRGTSLCVPRGDERFLGTLQQGAAIAWPVLDEYGVVPAAVARVDALPSATPSLVEVDVRNLAAGPRPTAMDIIAGAVAGRCEVETVDPRSGAPWSVLVSAALRREAGLPSGDDISGPDWLADEPASTRHELILRIIDGIRSCRTANL